MKIKITTRDGKFWFWWAGQLLETDSLPMAIMTAHNIIAHVHQLRIDAYTNSSIVLHA